MRRTLDYELDSLCLHEWAGNEVNSFPYWPGGLTAKSRMPYDGRHVFVLGSHSARMSDLPVIGWREWVGLPDLGISTIKAKVDTGARSSALHAMDVQSFERGGVAWVRFKVHPVQRRSAKTVTAEARVLDYRSVRSSSGEVAVRPVIATKVALLGVTWIAELTLANRDEMGFRMLLGREACRRRFLVDSGRSYYAGTPRRKSNRNVER